MAESSEEQTMKRKLQEDNESLQAELDRKAIQNEKVLTTFVIPRLEEQIRSLERELQKTKLKNGELQQFKLQHEACCKVKVKNPASEANSSNAGDHQQSTATNATAASKDDAKQYEDENNELVEMADADHEGCTQMRDLKDSYDQFLQAMKNHEQTLKSMREDLDRLNANVLALSPVQDAMVQKDEELREIRNNLDRIDGKLNCTEEEVSRLKDTIDDLESQFEDEREERANNNRPTPVPAYQYIPGAIYQQSYPQPAVSPPQYQFNYGQLPPF